jgi:hypothetical protein
MVAAQTCKSAKDTSYLMHRTRKMEYAEKDLKDLGRPRELKPK